MNIVWVKICIDVIFMLLSIFNLSHDMAKDAWGWVIWDSMLLSFWVYCLVKDTDELRTGDL